MGNVINNINFINIKNNNINSLAPNNQYNIDHSNNIFVNDSSNSISLVYGSKTITLNTNETVRVYIINNRFIYYNLNE